MAGDGSDVDLDGFTFLVDADAVPAGGRRIVTVENREIAVFDVDGEYYGLSNYCVHQGGPVCEGRISGAVTQVDGELEWVGEGKYVSCPWHGWEFEIETGRHITNERYRLPSYEIREVDGSLYAKL